ncbi:uncharacterized protein LOC124278544 [Haliotis rubra]|uniref:uncharacterized protein LOC124278544 n=1 Tax=Haliotis rubra TaxID=36100 RepID=UPI001EE5E46C|nr:uncharacterized protein LOC124278544 [Haliotis rubra]
MQCSFHRHIDWFYVPEFSDSRRQLEVKIIDSQHLLTRHRSAVCKGHLGHAKKQHFIQVAAENSTPLKLGMMEQQLNMQSTDFALITFSQNVQNSMETAGHNQSAELCKLVHDWFAANDEPGISAVERCQMKLRYRDYLLSLDDLSCFPPPGSHINGYSLALWEATISSIDADLQMYAITRRRTYNNRSLSSQPCESLYSSLATMPGARNGVPSAVDLEVNMAKICGECVVRQDPTRGFSTRLSSAPVYPQMLLEKGVGPLLEPKAVPTFIREITIQDHLFDAPQRRRLCRKEPRGISAIHESGKGGHGVRHFHKTDESKINPLIRAGLSVDSK